MKELPPHPYAELFPLRPGNSLIELSDSIAEHGQKEEIVLFERKVLDGRRRQAAAIRAGKKPAYREFGSRPQDGNDPLEFAFAVNYHRRDDMTQAEKVLAAVGYAKFKRGDNQHSVGDSSDTTNVGTSPKSQKQAAEKFGVNVKQIERAKAVLERGVPELQEAMKSEDVSISDAADIADEKPSVQRKAVKAVQSGEANTLKEAVGGMRPAAPETPARIAKELEGVIDRLGRVQTAKTQARDLAREGLQKALALIRQL